MQISDHLNSISKVRYFEKKKDIFHFHLRSRQVSNINPLHIGNLDFKVWIVSVFTGIVY